MTHEAGDGRCHELPEDQRCGDAKHQQREPYDYPMAKSVAVACVQA
jgi:hypothetical protein